MISVVCVSTHYFLQANKKFALQWILGIHLFVLFISLGGIVSYDHNLSNHSNWLVKNYIPNSKVVAIIQEPLIEKAKSYKAIASVEMVINQEIKFTEGKVILYFKKEDGVPALQYGSKILVHDSLQLINNTHNPASFDYKQYCNFQDIYFQAFLTKADYQILPSDRTHMLQNVMFTARSKTLSVIRMNISNANAKSIAEALLIGYRDDLDKDLVQTYSNTGVVHIIAISGMHIAMIYGLIIFCLRPFSQKKWITWFKPLLVLLIIWIFTGMAGAAPSLLRSAIMFSFIVIGESFRKRINIYNNLAASAFVIILLNPYSLWDVGFQLSYAAVLSIVIFSKPISSWLYFSNKLLWAVWQICAVTISAQILTLPFILFYFHQFPGLFIITNLVVVPLSGLILYTELLLLLVSFSSFIAHFVGSMLNFLIQSMNHFVLFIDSIPLSTLQSIQINIAQAFCLFIMISALSYWLLFKHAKSCILAAASLLLFLAMRSFDYLQKEQQQKLIVYHVPQHRAIDIFDGKQYRFTGDSIILQDQSLENFYVTPSRIAGRVEPSSQPENIYFQNNFIVSGNKRVFLIDGPLNLSVVHKKIVADAIVLSKGATQSVGELQRAFNCSFFIFDASNTMWKIKQWKKDCENLHLRHHSIPEQGAFVMDL